MCMMQYQVTWSEWDTCQWSRQQWHASMEVQSWTDTQSIWNFPQNAASWLHISVCMQARMSVFLFVSLSVFLPVGLFVCLSVCRVYGCVSIDTIFRYICIYPFTQIQYICNIRSSPMLVLFNSFENKNIKLTHFPKKLGVITKKNWNHHLVSIVSYLNRSPFLPWNSIAPSHEESSQKLFNEARTSWRHDETSERREGYQSNSMRKR